MHNFNLYGQFLLSEFVNCNLLLTNSIFTLEKIQLYEQKFTVKFGIPEATKKHFYKVRTKKKTARTYIEFLFIKRTNKYEANGQMKRKINKFNLLILL